MKTYRHGDRVYRQLHDYEKIRIGDYLFCELYRKGYDPDEWFECQTTVGQTPAKCRCDYDYSGFVWVREVDPLIVAMIEAKDRHENKTH